MALEDLIAAMERDAAEEARRRLDGAAVEARRIAAQAEEGLRQRREEALGRLEAELRAETEAALAAAARDARREVLFAREGLLESVFRAAAAKLPELVADQRYLAAAAADLDEATGYLPEGGALLRCSPGLLGLARRRLAFRPETAVEADETIGSGFVLEAADGRSFIDATLERRLADQRASLALVVLQRLEAPPPGDAGLTVTATKEAGRS